MPKSTTCPRDTASRASALCATKTSSFLSKATRRSRYSGPSLSFAAKIYKGGIEIQSLDQFLGFAVRLEEDAAIHYDELGTAMDECGNIEVAKLFHELAGYSRLHLAQARVARWFHRRLGCIFRRIMFGPTTPRPREPLSGPATRTCPEWMR